MDNSEFRRRRAAYRACVTRTHRAMSRAADGITAALEHWAAAQRDWRLAQTALAQFEADPDGDGPTLGDVEDDGSSIII